MPTQTFTQRAQILAWITPRLGIAWRILVPQIMQEFGISRMMACKYRTQAQEMAIAQISKQRAEIIEDLLVFNATIMNDPTLRPGDRIKAAREIANIVGAHAPKQVAVQVNEKPLYNELPSLTPEAIALQQALDDELEKNSPTE